MAMRTILRSILLKLTPLRFSSISLTHGLYLWDMVQSPLSAVRVIVPTSGWTVLIIDEFIWTLARVFHQWYCNLGSGCNGSVS